MRSSRLILAGSLTFSIAKEKIVTEAVQRALPISLCCSLLISIVCSLLLSKGITKPIFLRAASHELKTPVTALNATLENMILGVGKYQDCTAFLPECKEMVEQLANMIHDILETSRLKKCQRILVTLVMS